MLWILGWMNSKGKLASCGRGEKSRRNRQIRGNSCLCFQTMDFVGQIHLCELCLLRVKAQESKCREFREQRHKHTTLYLVSPVLPRIQWFPRAGQPGFRSQGTIRGASPGQWDVLVFQKEQPCMPRVAICWQSFKATSDLLPPRASTLITLWLLGCGGAALARSCTGCLRGSALSEHS